MQLRALVCDQTLPIECKLEGRIQSPSHPMANPSIDMPRIEISASDLAVLAGKSRWTHPWTLLEPMLRRMDPDRHSVFVRSYPMAPPDPRLDDYLRTCQEPLRSLVSEYVSIACACAKNPRLIADQIEALPRWFDTQEVPEGQRETLSRLMAGEIRCAYGKTAEDNYITLLESCPIMPDAVWQRSHLNRSCVITFLPPITRSSCGARRTQ